MKKHILFLLTITLATNSYAQISFEKGYYINNDDQKIECFIKDVDWKNNPTEFEYKKTENSNKKSASIEDIKEFAVGKKLKYVRSRVKIDRSSSIIEELSGTRKPIFKEELLFLKVIVEGKSILYEYADGSLMRYFYSVENSEIEQLVFKPYRVGDTGLKENNRFRQQLWISLKCSTFTMNKIDNIDYKKNELIRFFIEHNECNNQEFINFEEKEKREKFNLTVRPGFNSSFLSIENYISSVSNIEFAAELAFRFGIEGEFILPFNNNKWTVIIEPTYQYYKTEQFIEDVQRDVEVDYQSVELPIGIRHYFFLNEDSKLFVNASMIFDFNTESYIDTGLGVLEVVTRNNLGFGAGYKYKNRYSLEFRYQTGREILDDYVYWSSDYVSLSAIVGYKLF